MAGKYFKIFFLFSEDFLLNYRILVITLVITSKNCVGKTGFVRAAANSALIKSLSFFPMEVSIIIGSSYGLKIF